nr:protein phosphatase 2C 32 [Ziziphus jujuba var. spinosa]
MVNKKGEISICRLKMGALQLFSDHSTNIEEPTCNGALLEIFRVDYVELHPSIIHHRLSPICGTLSYGLYRYSSNEEVVAHITRLMEKVPEGMDFRELLDIPYGDDVKYHDDVAVMMVSLEGRIWRSSG